MTEAQWLTCTKPTPMLEFLRDKVSERRLRLFAVSCCRRVWDKVPQHDRRAVELAEQFADGKAAEQELVDLQRRMSLECEGRLANQIGDGWASAYHALKFPAWEAADSAFRTAAIAAWVDLPGYHSLDYRQEWPRAYRKVRACEYGRQAGLLRDIFGNPFRPVAIDPAWLSWHDGLLVSMARQMYESRDFTDLPILADALEEAGCTDQDILGHCRSGGKHVRGCWVIDLLLGKQ